MKRRDFLKVIGLAIAAPGALLGAVKATPPKTSWIIDENLQKRPGDTIVFPNIRAQARIGEQALKETTLDTWLGRWIVERMDGNLIAGFEGIVWNPPLRRTNKPLVINRIRPK